ncbi:MAG: hypothetical protein L6R35_000293 [Caloplaca aegaea]|nr:MAG: hypothetical protein L6R35_000293 [Caloplaca aegaea]
MPHDLGIGMAPDLNTMHRTNRNTSASVSNNRSPDAAAPSSNPMPPPSTNQFLREPGSAEATSNNPFATDNAGVNRLTRELSLLRQQTASVASTTSSTSTGFADSTDKNANHLISGASHPTPSRRHRSSSSLSTRSMNTTATTASGYTGLSGSTVGTTGGVAGSTVSGIAPARDSHAAYPTHAQSLSRQNSTASSRRSQASSPSLSSSLLQGDHFPNLMPLRQPSLFQPHPPLGQLPQHTLSPAASARSSYVHSSAATARYEESAHQRAEMESVKRENETLRRRIRELETRLTSNRHARSDSESTGTSAPRRSAASAYGHDGSLDCDEDAVHVGESAGSVGVGVTAAAAQTTKLVLDLQTIAHNAGHPVPLAIGLDQENGGVNSLFDEAYIRQFPSAMGVAATGSTDMAYAIAKATGQELSAVGINWIMGPCLDVLTNVKNQPLGVRSMGDDPEEVSKFGVAFKRGYKDAGLATCGKHFPSYGNLEFLGSSLDVPIITDSLEQLSLSALVPFRNAISQGVDGMMVGGCAMSSAGVNVMHACLSEQVVDMLLRDDLGFDGVVMSECLEMEALSQNIGVGGGTVMAVNAGCDLVLLCRLFSVQQEAIRYLKLGYEDGAISAERIHKSLKRVLDLKATCTNWEKALNPTGILDLSRMQPEHTKLSSEAYNASITVVRDKGRLLPLSHILDSEEEILLLTPLVKPLPASALAKGLAAGGIISPGSHTPWGKSMSLMSGENIFREFGRSIARKRQGRLLHTSYTAHGVRPSHENLVNRAAAVIVVTADANQNLYQNGFTKHIAMICKSALSGADRREKPMVVVSVSSPYDFALDTSIGTYVCSYDFTETALQTVVEVLVGDLTPTGTLPGTVRQKQKTHHSKQHWLVENFDEEQDATALDDLLQRIEQEGPVNQRSELIGCSSKTFALHNPAVEEAHYVVRNSSTRSLLGFCCTYLFKSTATAVVGAILVDPDRRKLSIGHSLHTRAIRSLLHRGDVNRFQLGSRLPGVYLGIPANNQAERKQLRRWFAGIGWNTAVSRPVCSLILNNLATWTAPEQISLGVQHADFEFELVHGRAYAEPIIEHIKRGSRPGVMEVYQLALADDTSCGVIQAKRAKDGSVLGSVVLCSPGASWADALPPLKDTNDITWAISSPVISPDVGEYSTLLQGLILLGIRQVKQQQADAVLLDCMDGDGHFDSLSVMGFNVLHNFEEVSCDAESISVSG